MLRTRRWSISSLQVQNFLLRKTAKMDNFKTRRFQLIECPVGTQQANQDYNFTPQQLLQSVTGGQKVYIRQMAAYCTNAIAKSPITPSNTVASPTDIQGAFLTLSVLGTERFKRVPLAQMNNVWSDTATYAPFVMNRFLLENVWGIDWTQSFVTTTVAASAAPLSFLFGIWFEYSDDMLADNQ
jgi:hypothetical protein